MKKIFAFVALLFLAACGSLPGAVNQTLPTAADEQIGVLVPRSAMLTNARATPTVDEVGTAMMVLARDAATSTSAAAATGTSYVVTSTQEAKATQAFWVGVTLAVGTQRATETQIAKTSVAGTQQAEYQTAVPMTMTMVEATRIIQQDELKSKRVSIWINQISCSIILLGFVALALFVLFKGALFGEKYGQARNLQTLTNALKPDEHGRHPLVPASALNNDKLINPNLMHRSVLDPKAADDLTSEQALANTNAHNKLEAVRSISTAPMLRNMAKALLSPQQPAAPVTGDVKITKPDQPLLDSNMPPLLPDWELFSSWTGGAVPLGLGTKGLITANSASPHLLISGITGVGKTRFMLRPTTAASLSKGYQVIQLGLSANGYGVFDNHPNYYRIALRDASDIIEYLKSIYRELRERDKLIGGQDLTWDRWPGGTPPKPSILILLDELGNLAETIYTDEDDPAGCKEMWSYLSMIAREGRKVGIEFSAAIQEPTAKSVDLRFRRNCTLIAFQLGDQSSSTAYLGTSGAESLEIGYFMAKVNGVVYGGGFSPTDQEITSFLAGHPVQQLPPPNWIDGIVKEESMPVVSSVTQSTPATPAAISQSLTEARAKAEETIQIQDLYVGYLNSKIRPNFAEMERTVYGKTGGSFHNNVKKALALFEGVTVEEVNAVIEKHVAEWSTTPSATTGLNGLISPDLDINPV